MSDHQLFIGTSGWSYQHWQENFYPPNLKTVNWLPYYSRSFSTVEINTTFYHLPLESSVINWHNRVSDDFIFSVKASRYITHLKRLKDCQEALETFYTAIRPLKEKCGPILFQLPPSFAIDLDRLKSFLDLLDKKHLYTFEFRHPSWFIQKSYDLLAKYQIALCITDLNGKLSPEVLTTDFTYIRLHGPHQAYKGSYGLAKLKEWKRKIEHWNEVASVYCYFDNDEKGYAIEDAKLLQDLFQKNFSKKAFKPSKANKR